VRSPFTLFLNPDAVLEPAALRTMLGFLERSPQAGIVGPAIIEGEGAAVELQDTGDRPTPWTIARNALPVGGKPLSHLIEPGSPPCKTQWVCGAVLLARTDLLRRLDGFDPRFFLYWEEMDLCKRAEAAGFETWALGTAVARHVGGASSSPDDTRIAGCIARHYFQSRYYYMIKHHGRVAAAAAESLEFLSLGARSLVDLARGRGLGRLRPRFQAPLYSQPEP
jgi:GT2 family glycosyltransferase